MADYADLELGIHRWDAESYSIELRFSQPESDADIRLVRGAGHPNQLRLDPARLLELAADPAGYGAYLGEALFADREIESAFEQARTTAETLRLPLRTRFYIGPTAPELHSVRWEAMRSRSGEPLFLGEQVLFSRYLTSADRQPVQPKPRGAMRALIVVAGPDSLEKFQLAPVDVPAELARAQAGLEGFEQVALAEPGAAGLEHIVERLRAAAHDDRPFDILYLVSHGSFSAGTTYLWLTGPGNTIARVSGDDLVQRIRELPQRPRLVVLVACQTAGAGGPDQTGDNGALAALGPRLAEAGVPAVIAMQGNVSVDLVARFVPIFFRELQRDGQIDRAVAVARGSVRDHPDAWVPALYMRFKSGRIWYVPGFGEESESFEKWPALIRYLRRGQATPVIGAFMSEALLGSSRDIARSWADTYDYPMEAHEREDLPQVAQYLATKQDYRFVRDELIEYMRGQLLARYSDSLLNPDATISELFAVLGENERQRNPADPYKVLAELPLPIYVTTNAANLLGEALRAAGKQPVVEICRWNEDLETLPSIFEDEPAYQPSAERPLVFHLFGTLDEPDSLVLTEDDYFDFLIGVSQNRELVPIVVRQALADTALLFLGFRLDDWAFRVVFRSLMSQQGRSRRTRYTHIAGQLLPQENEVLEPDRASRYLETYFSDADISIYWGSARDFARELHEQLGATPADAREARDSRRRSRF